uniref:Outer membrane protein assembly factor BamA n=1 Tax=candidate division WOR-3 bacterium TaxID=2052148 RepID=A0A7C4UDN5_UNCW3
MFFLLIALFPYDEVIMEIGVKGVKNIDTILVLTVSGLKIGDILTPETGERCIKNLYSTELFRNIKLEALRSEYGGINVIINVEEFPKIKEIDISGNKNIKKKDIEKVIDITLPKIVSDRKLFEISNKIKEIYREKGFKGTKVEIQREEIEGGERITFGIEEGKKLRLKEVEFIGNNDISDKKLSGKIKTKGRKNWWSFWIKGEIVDTIIENDFKLIEDFYREKGYLDARTDSFRIEEIGNYAVIKFFVYEGKKYRLGNITFSGNEFLKDPERFIKMEKGLPFNNKKFESSLQNLYSYYTDNGYLYVNINPSFNFRGDTVDVDVRIMENNKVYVKFIDIIGNLSTYDKVIRRYLTIYPGDVFSRDKIISSQQNLFRLGYFENLLFNIRKESTLDSVSLIFEVKEKQTGQVSAGMGYSKDAGITGNVSINIPNFLGKGQTVNLTYERTVAQQTGTRPIQYLTFGFNEPWLFDTPTSVGFSIFSTYRLWENFTEYRTGFQFDIGRIVGESKDVTISGNYRFSRNKIDCDTAKTPDYIDEQYGVHWESSISTNILKDSRDNYFYPKSGTYISFSPKLSGTILGGDINYYRINFEIKRFLEIYKEFVIMNRIFFGHIQGLKGSTTPLIERYLLGGSGFYGIRGYRDNIIKLPKGYGGNEAIIMNLELRRNITNMIYVSAFIDAGNTFEELSKIDITDLYTGAGFGFRIEIPMMGIFGLDIGYGFDKVKGGRWETHFQLGQSF